MEKYRGTYRVFQEVDSTGNLSANKQATYLKHKRGEIYRWNAENLVITFNSSNTKTSFMKSILDYGIEFKQLQLGDNESSFIFNEKYLTIVAEHVNITVKGKNKSLRSCAVKEKIKRIMTDEQKQVLRDRMLLIREKCNKTKK